MGLTDWTDRIKAWLQIAVFILVISSTVSVGAVKLLGVQTEEDYQATRVQDQADIQGQLDRLHTDVRRLTTATRCILWEVPVDRCEETLR